MISKICAAQDIELLSAPNFIIPVDRYAQPLCGCENFDIVSIFLSSKKQFRKKSIFLPGVNFFSGYTECCIIAWDSCGKRTAELVF